MRPADRTDGGPAAGQAAADPALARRLRAVRLASFDVDGVLTDGRIYVGDDGREQKAFHALDGVGMKRLAAAGIAVAWITGSASPSVAHRARALGVAHLIAGVEDKLPAWTRLIASLGVPADACAHVGDDLPDLPMQTASGFAASVPGAPDDVRRRAHYVTRREGGRGAAREIADLILAARGAA